MFMSKEHHVLFIYDILITDPTVVCTLVHVILKNIVNVEGISYFTFMSPNKGIKFDRCDCIGT